MKRFISLLIGFLMVQFSYFTIQSFENKTLATINYEEEIADNYELTTFSAIEILAPHISHGINSYYGRDRFVDFQNVKVIDFKSLNENNTSYEVTLQLVTAEANHKGPYGVERITLLNESGNIKITNFIHVATSQKK